MNTDDLTILCPDCGAERDVDLGPAWSGGECPECGYEQYYRSQKPGSLEAYSVEVF